MRWHQGELDLIHADETGRMNNFSAESIILVCVCIVYVCLLM